MASARTGLRQRERLNKVTSYRVASPFNMPNLYEQVALRSVSAGRASSLANDDPSGSRSDHRDVARSMRHLMHDDVLKALCGLLGQFSVKSDALRPGVATTPLRFHLLYEEPINLDAEERLPLSD